MNPRFEAEIREFHDDLADWFTGKSPKTDAGYAGLAGVIADDFMLISPSGMVAEDFAGQLKTRRSGSTANQCPQGSRAARASRGCLRGRRSRRRRSR